MTLNDVATQLTSLLQQIEMELGCNNEIDPELDDNKEFIPPLQTEIELLKKNSGVESSYDEQPMA